MCGANDNLDDGTEKRFRAVIYFTDPAYTDIFESLGTLKDALGHDFDDVSVDEMGPVSVYEVVTQPAPDVDPHTGIRHFLGMES